MLVKIDGACPESWEPIRAGFIGGAQTVVDAWQGDAVDRGAFLAYLDQEMAAENLTSEELEAMAGDPMAVVAECAYQKLRFMRLMAFQASEVTAAGSFTTSVDLGGPPVPDGSTQEYAAESCEFIREAYPSAAPGDYWIDPDGGDTSNAQIAQCNLGYDIRHLRFIAESEINGKVYTSMAELNLLDVDEMPVARDAWEITYYDSEELVGENGAAANAIDGDSSTIWHTEWYANAPPHPHEIRVDLGETVRAIGLKYLPRQYGVNGTVAAVKIYGSDDGVAWNLLVSKTLAADTSEKTIYFE